ncbi:histidine kinase [Vibrio sp. UCD-FRSSP16_10]|uniref:sensor histidine kinase n=1 Tax=unclassified Vibrio TaxID=2614977 RepID=UPI0007FBB435|nr:MULTISPECIES: HAMP domain-containing sensor histidine kinase [unclassified Vibrio]OBT15588.1 histidine kinase [Vibrio sp. UCD-FRSSP16_30]OBT20660.1 histidine kinase [Vibrio sp. UCD-FRSSP16_10]
MKIRQSLRLYFLAIMFFVGSMTIVIMSGVAISYFFSGMDIVMESSMRTQAHQAKPSDNHPITLGRTTVASRWQDLPQSIRHQFKEADLAPNELIKHIDGIPLIDPPKTGYFAMKVVENDSIVYVSLQLPNTTSDTRFRNEKNPYFFYVIFIALGALFFFSAALFGILRIMSEPVENLRDWAKSLDKEKLKQPVPNFQYSELNSLAGIVQSSLSSVQDSLDREKQFLGYASHELRTPIAVTRTNTELLRKMISKDVDKAKQEEVLERIERAAFTMTDLTETLLWLNRQEDKSLPSTTITLGELVTQIKQELFYVLHGKQVDVFLESDNTKLDLPLGLCRIVITNLIRNAFQHTTHGEVVIKQVATELRIDNYNHSENESEQQLGFGLGLELTERLIKQYGWHYQNTLTPSGRSVLIEFKHQKAL